MALNPVISGMQQVLQNLKKAQDKLGAGFERGCVRGGKFLFHESQKLVPFQTGNLHASGFIENFGGRGAACDIIVGYRANYAAYVHENLYATHGADFNIKYAAEIGFTRALAKRMHRKVTTSDVFFNRGARQQAKFLEQPAREFRDQILRMVAEETGTI
jgi:hypothetical protein